MKKTFIVSNWSGFYESIGTEESYCKFFLQVKYLFKGYRVWAIPTIGMAKIIFKLFGVRTYKGINLGVEKFVKGSGQVTYWQPWMNVN